MALVRAFLTRASCGTLLPGNFLFRRLQEHSKSLWSFWYSKWFDMDCWFPMENFYVKSLRRRHNPVWVNYLLLYPFDIHLVGLIRLLSNRSKTSVWRSLLLFVMKSFHLQPNPQCWFNDVQLNLNFEVQWKFIEMHLLGSWTGARRFSIRISRGINWEEQDSCYRSNGRSFFKQHESCYMIALLSIEPVFSVKLFDTLKTHLAFCLKLWREFFRFASSSLPVGHWMPFAFKS